MCNFAATGDEAGKDDGDDDDVHWLRGRDRGTRRRLPLSLPPSLSPRQPTNRPTQVARRARCTLNKQRHTFVLSPALSLARSPRIGPEGSVTRYGYENVSVSLMSTEPSFGNAELQDSRNMLCDAKTWPKCSDIVPTLFLHPKRASLRRRQTRLSHSALNAPLFRLKATHLTLSCFSGGRKEPRELRLRRWGEADSLPLPPSVSNDGTTR